MPRLVQRHSLSGHLSPVTVKADDCNLRTNGVELSKRGSLRSVNLAAQMQARSIRIDSRRASG